MAKKKAAAASVSDALAEIAKEYLSFPTLETRNCGLDFKEVAVWSVANALQAAFAAGFKSAGGLK